MTTFHTGQRVVVTPPTDATRREHELHRWYHRNRTGEVVSIAAGSVRVRLDPVPGVSQDGIPRECAFDADELGPES